MKKGISVFLAALLLLGICSPAAFAAKTEERGKYDTSKPPILLIDGINARDLVLDIGTKTAKTVFPFTADDVLALIRENLGAVWDTLDGDFSQESEDAVIDAVIELLEGVAMNNDGTSKYNVEVDWLYPLQTRETEEPEEEGGFDLGEKLAALRQWFSSLFHKDAGALTEEELMEQLFQNPSTYKFQYDWRLDMYELADRMRDYIDYMKELTGFDTVSIVGFSEGAAVLNTYLSVYGYDNLDTVIWYGGAHNGVELVGQLFTGRISVDPDALTEYFRNTEEESAGASVLAAVMRYLNSVGFTGNILEYTNKIIDKLLADGAIRRLLRETVGKMPAIWSLIGDDYYEEAKAYVFNEPGDAETYAGLLEKIDAYHYNVQKNSAAIMQTAKEAAGKIGVISKYGRRVLPIIDHSTVQADGIIDLKGTSCGAVAADIGQTLGEGYTQAVNDGHNHLSADGAVDASAALYPEYTWFLKNAEHSQGVEYIDDLIFRICYADHQVTVFEDGNFPQFSVFSPIENTTRPLLDAGQMTAVRRVLLRFKTYFLNLFENLKQFFRR